MSLSAALIRNLSAMLAELRVNPMSDVRVWLDNMRSLAELIQRDSDVVKRTAERNTERNSVTDVTRNIVRSDVRSRLESHSPGL